MYIYLVSLSSCVKEDYCPLPPEPVVETGHVHNHSCYKLWGRWKLIGAEMYLTNLSTTQEWSEDLFEYDNINSLRYSGPMYDFEVIEKNVTVWRFKRPYSVPGVGEFILNSDTLNPYGLNVTTSNYTIIEHPTTDNENDLLLGGSSRPIQPYFDGDCHILQVTVQETYENINGYNHRYHTILKFKKIH